VKNPKFVNIMQKGITPIFEAEEAEIFPTVFYTADVEVAIRHIVASQKEEVAWMGLVEQIGEYDYLIEKLYIPTQQVSAATAEIDEKAIAELTNKILDAGLDPSMLRYHGHSHVNMGVTPSMVDQDHMFDYLEHADWFIREIRNKRGEKKVDVFNKTRGVAFQCVDTEIWELAKEAEFYEAIDLQLKESVTKRIFTPYKYSQNNFPITPSEVKNAIMNTEHAIYDAEEMEYTELMSDPFGVRDTWHGRL